MASRIEPSEPGWLENAAGWRGGGRQAGEAAADFGRRVARLEYMDDETGYHNWFVLEEPECWNHWKQHLCLRVYTFSLCRFIEWVKLRAWGSHRFWWNWVPRSRRMGNRAGVTLPTWVSATWDRATRFSTNQLSPGGGAHPSLQDTPLRFSKRARAWPKPLSTLKHSPTPLFSAANDKFNSK